MNTENKFMGTSDAVKKWGLCENGECERKAQARITRWCRNDKIIGAEQDGKNKPWRIPIDATPPAHFKKT
ncbi:MAG: hypothetical protein FWF81_14520 [Defluviitaleaceae bacterium]|nr:hypothetical protein [Defluviitaleaceae bacterium]